MQHHVTSSCSCKTRRWRKYSDILRMYLLYVATISLQKYRTSKVSYFTFLWSTHSNSLQPSSTSPHISPSIAISPWMPPPPAAACHAAVRCHLLNHLNLPSIEDGATTAAVPSPCHQSPRNMPPPPPSRCRGRRVGAAFFGCRSSSVDTIIWEKWGGTG